MLFLIYKRIKEITTIVAEYIEELKEKNETLEDYVEFLNSCLDDREKSIELLKEENKKLKEELEKLKSTYVYDAKQVRDIC